MTYRILRNENSKSAKGVDEVFLQVEISDTYDIYTKAEWLIAADVAKVKADPTAINAIAEELANRGVLGRPQQLKSIAHQQALDLARAQNSAQAK